MHMVKSAEPVSMVTNLHIVNTSTAGTDKPTNTRNTLSLKDRNSSLRACNIQVHVYTEKP